MSKKETKTRTSAKQKFAEYRSKVSDFIHRVINPRTSTILKLASYSPDKKPNAASVPELLAIVGTAQKLGKVVIVQISGINELEFAYFDKPEYPLELL